MKGAAAVCAAGGGGTGGGGDGEGGGGNGGDGDGDSGTRGVMVTGMAAPGMSAGYVMTSAGKGAARDASCSQQYMQDQRVSCLGVAVKHSAGLL